MYSDICPVCSSNKIKLFIKGISDITFKTTTEVFDVFHCEKCDAKFQNPFIPENVVGKYYPSADYHPFRTNHNLVSINLKYNPASIYMRTLLKKHKPSDSFSLIDIGCGGGTFLMTVKAYFPNAFLMGVDVSEIAINNLNLGGIDGVCCSLYSFDINKKFDYIVSSQVLEHLNNPNTFVQKLTQLANEDTFIMIDVPASDSYSARKFTTRWVHWDLPRHSILYSKITLEYLLDKNFTKIKLLRGGSFLAFFNSYKLSKNRDIYKQTLPDRIFLKLVTPFAKLFNLNFLFDDKLIWIGKLKKNEA